MTNPETPRARVRFGHRSPDRSAPVPFGTGGALAGVLFVALVVGGLFWSATSAPPASAERPRLFGGSLVLEDTRPLTVIDVATAQVTVRLEGVNAQVGAAADGDVQPVPVAGGTVLVNRSTGSFNFLEADDYVTDPNGPGVGLGPLAGSTGAEGLGSGPDAYILRAAPASTVSLVGRQTVAAAAKAQAGPAAASSRHRAIAATPAAAIPPLGYSALGGPVRLGAGSAAVSGPDLWVLVGRSTGCRLVRLRPVATSPQGLATSDRAVSTASCDRSAVEAGSRAVGFATPGQVQVFPAGGPAVKVPTPFTLDATRILPVTGAGGRLWFLADMARGWELFGVGPAGRGVATVGPFVLAGLGPAADPVAPALSAGFLYTLDQRQSGQPTLWTIDVTNGHMAPLRGVPRYPVLTKAEKAGFRGAQVVVDGPRVVFNNPQSLEAVVVFTDSSRLPVIVDKSQAVTVSTTGPADLSSQTSTTLPGSKGKSHGSTGPSAPSKSAVPVVQPVSQQVTCATTTQKPYAPQITGITASSGTALIQWSYQLFDQTDCEPDSWSVQVKALTGGHQPATPVKVVYGQDQYLFTGLRPTTTYQVVVTAYINRQSTPSAPATFTTAARGPDAPLSVHTEADGNGNWVVSWTPCTESANPNCVVPADQWTVTGSACNGSFVGTPPSVSVAGSQDTVTINAANLQMLGDYLSFTVQGSLASGLTGNPTADHSCTEAYQKPDASAITVTGQGTQPAGSNSITATLTVGSSGNPATVFGVPASDAQFVYTLTSSAGTRTVGPTNQTSVAVPGLPPGVAFTPSVLVYPDGHPNASATVTGTPFEQTLAWPDLSATSATGTVDNSNPDQGTVTVTLPPDAPADPLTAVAPTTANSPGAGPEIQCGGTGGAVLTYPVQAVGPAHQLRFPMPDLVDSGGDCTVSFSLTDGADPNPYGGPSPVLTVPFTIGLPAPSYSFTFSYVGCGNFKCGPLGKQYTIEVDSSDHYAGGGDWTVTAEDANLPQATDPCYVSEADSTLPDKFRFQLPQGCVPVGSFTVSMQWRYIGQQQSVDAAATNSPGSPATTTTSSTSTTLPPCPSTTSSTSTPSTTGCTPPTTSGSSSTTTSGTAAGVATGGAIPGGALALAWAVGTGRKARARRKTKKESR